MFVGRERELEILENCFARGSFQLVVLYGRRRVGKTTLLLHFAEGKHTLFYTAQEQGNLNNLADFSSCIARFFGLPEGTSFETWNTAFEYLADRAEEEPFLFVFDEFPYAAQSDPSLPSKLQIAIDHRFKSTGLCMVLCGSSQGFMESKVLGKKSPLHGRRTTQIKLKPFGYREAAFMVNGASSQDAFKYYASVGGTPYYLSLIEAELSFEENIGRMFFSPEGYLYSEPTMLLRQELREPAVYNSVLRAIAHGANRHSQIADKAGVGQTAVSSYLGVLEQLGIVERIVPFGENPSSSRKGIYRIRDACYDFWYRFVAPHVPDIEAGAGRLAAVSATGQNLSTYLGGKFEAVCLEWLLAQALGGHLPIQATTFGSWWGNDPNTREQTDIDVVAGDRNSKTALIGECKWRSSFDETKAIKTLLSKENLVRGYKTQGFYLFSKNDVSTATNEKHGKRVTFVTLDDLYDVAD